MRLTAILSVLALSAMLLAGAQSALADDDISVSIVSADDSAFPEVTVVLTADQRGRPIADIGPQDLQIEETGSPATPVSIQRAVDQEVPLALIVMLDVSGSMEGSTLANAQASAIALLESLAETDRAAVLAFADEVSVEQALTQDGAALMDAVSRMRAGGDTALYDAVAESAAVAAASGVSRRAVVLLTDGNDHGSRSKLTREQSLEAVSQGASLFYVIGVGSAIDQAYLEELASRSGGRFFRATGASDIPAVYASLEELLRSQYVVTFEASSAADHRDRTVSISVTQGSSTGSAERAYRSLRPPPAPQAAPEPVLPAEPQAPEPDASDDSSSIMVIVPTIGAVAVLIVGGGLFWRQRRRAGGSRLAPTGSFTRPVTEAPSARSNATVVVASGPQEGRSYQVGSRPVTIGSENACDICLARAPGVAREHARIWWRDGRLMLHHIAPGHVTMLDGKSVLWGAVEDGDELGIGPYVLRCVTPEGEAEVPSS